MSENNTEVPPPLSKDEKEFTIHAMFTDGSRHTYSIKKSSNVTELITMIKNDDTVTKPEDKTIAVIYRGRILNLADSWSNIENLMDEFAVQICFRVNQVANTAPVVQELRGFDRLQRMNYTAEQIEEIRRNFHQMHGTTSESTESRLDVEDEWFPVLFNQENPLDALNVNLNNLAGATTNGRGNTNTRRNRHNRAENLINTEDNNNNEIIAPTNAYEEGSAVSLQLMIGFLLGLMFGIISLLIILINLRDKFIIIGLCIGIIGNLSLSYFLGFSFF